MFSARSFTPGWNVPRGHRSSRPLSKPEGRKISTAIITMARTISVNPISWNGNKFPIVVSSFRCVLSQFSVWRSISEESATAAIPRESIIYEDSNARVWVVNEDSSIKLRAIKLGYTDGRLVQVLDGVKAGQKIICKGSLFIDRIASGPKS